MPPPKKPQRPRLFGAPEPERFGSTPEGRMLKNAASLHFRARTDKGIDRLLAVEKLVLDIFQDTQAARAFAVNPEEYLRRSGFANVTLDLNSQEVKIAMAVGDPLARQAAARGDVNGFVDAIAAQGITPSVGLGTFVHVEALVHSSVLVYFIAVVVTYQKVTTATAIPIVVIGNPTIESARHVKVLRGLAEHIGDAAFAKRVAAKSAADMILKYEELARATRRQP